MAGCGAAGGVTTTRRCTRGVGVSLAWRGDTGGGLVRQPPVEWSVRLECVLKGAGNFPYALVVSIMVAKMLLVLPFRIRKRTTTEILNEKGSRRGATITCCVAGGDLLVMAWTR